MEFYDVKRKQKVEVDEADVEIITLSNGRPAARAELKVDGEVYKLFKIIKKSEAEKLAK
tara:strand:+ start:343 stop:519 length:177 start_codon:yes stop_codon:yes gene_type:complete